MDDHFRPVPDMEALTELFAPTQPEPVLLFLHDPHCGVSAAARRVLAALATPVYVVDVAWQTALSRAVASQTGIQHASPQAFVLERGQVRWSGSHRAITTEAVRRATEGAVLGS